MSSEKQAGFGFDEPLPARQMHSETSKAAAREIQPAAGTLRAKVLRFLQAFAGEYGATDEQMQVYLDMAPNTQRPRRIELVRAGLVEDSGEKRKTKSGRKAVVWRAK